MNVHFHFQHLTHSCFSSDKTDDTQKALGIVLELLDYACWRTNLGAWKCLKTIIENLQSQSR